MGHGECPREEGEGDECGRERQGVCGSTEACEEGREDAALRVQRPHEQCGGEQCGARIRSGAQCGLAAWHGVHVTQCPQHHVLVSGKQEKKERERSSEGREKGDRQSISRAGVMMVGKKTSRNRC